VVELQQKYNRKSSSGEIFVLGEFFFRLPVFLCGDFDFGNSTDPTK
jgi:hypothetical protein